MLRNFLSDFEGYDKFRSRFSKSIFTSNQLKTIWNRVRQENKGLLSILEQYQIAVVYAEEALAGVLEEKPTRTAKKVAKTTSPTTTAATQNVLNEIIDIQSEEESKSFFEYLELFEGLMNEEELLCIWQSVFLCSDDGAVCVVEKANSAILYAYESTNKDEAETFITSIDGIALQSAQEAALGFVCRVFDGSGVSRETIESYLTAHKYDVEGTIAALSDRKYLKAELSPRGTGTGALPHTHKENAYLHAAQKPEVPGFLVFPVSSFKASTITTNNNNNNNNNNNSRRNSYSSSRNKHNEKELALAMHFLSVFEGLNPHVKVSLTADSEFVFHGVHADSNSNSSSSRDGKDKDSRYVLNVSIDLHGLDKKHALQVVRSSVAFYHLPGDSEATTTTTARKRKGAARTYPQTGATRRKVMLRYIVGRGLHSEGGRPRLGPAIQGYLHRYSGLESLLPLDSGVVLVCIGQQIGY